MPFRVYIDACIFIEYYDLLADTNRRKEVVDCLETIKQNPRKIVLVTSDFTFTELVKVLQSKDGLEEAEIYKILSELARIGKIGKKYPFKLIDAEGEEEDYTFNDFFVGLQELLLNTRPGLADTIHALIMMNNKVNRILTFDTQDFNKIQKIEAIHPNEIKSFVESIYFKNGKAFLPREWKKKVKRHWRFVVNSPKVSDVSLHYNHLEYEIPKLENREYLLYDKDTHQYASCITKIFHEEPKFKSLRSNEPFLNRVIPRKSITRKMKNHDGIGNDLNEKLKSIENSLENKIDFEAVKRMVMAHNTENPGQEINLLSEDYKKEQAVWPSARKEEMLEHVIAGIINGKYEFSSQKGSKFWNKYGPAFLEMRNDIYTAKQLGELEQKSNRMLNDCKNLKKELGELRESLKDYYNIPHEAVPIYRLPK